MSAHGAHLRNIELVCHNAPDCLGSNSPAVRNHATHFHSISAQAEADTLPFQLTETPCLPSSICLLLVRATIQESVIEVTDSVGTDTVVVTVPSLQLGVAGGKQDLTRNNAFNVI